MTTVQQPIEHREAAQPFVHEHGSSRINIARTLVAAVAAIYFFIIPSVNTLAAALVAASFACKVGGYIMDEYKLLSVSGSLWEAGIAVAILGATVCP